jgi:Methionyl-tRNA formyltransferase
MSSPPQPLLLLSSRPWNKGLAERLRVALERPVRTIGKPAELQLEAVAELDPAWIFVPHWSHWIPEAIWSRWPTVIFHMTDLPYGRGGSPLQNLIQRGHSSTMLTALRRSAQLDESAGCWRIRNAASSSALRRVSGRNGCGIRRWWRGCMRRCTGRPWSRRVKVSPPRPRYAESMTSLV